MRPFIPTSSRLVPFRHEGARHIRSLHFFSFFVLFFSYRESREASAQTLSDEEERVIIDGMREIIVRVSRYPGKNSEGKHRGVSGKIVASSNVGAFFSRKCDFAIASAGSSAAAQRIARWPRKKGVSSFKALAHGKPP